VITGVISLGIIRAILLLDIDAGRNSRLKVFERLLFGASEDG